MRAQAIAGNTANAPAIQLSPVTMSIKDMADIVTDINRELDGLFEALVPVRTTFESASEQTVSGPSPGACPVDVELRGHIWNLQAIRDRVAALRDQLRVW